MTDKAFAEWLVEKNLLKPDGRGMFYMGKFMDQVSYDFGTTGGTEVTLRKRLVSTETAPEKQEEDR